MKAGYQVIPGFQVTQHSHDAELMIKLVTYLGCGRIESVSSRESRSGLSSALNFLVTNFSRKPQIYEEKSFRSSINTL